MGIQDANFNFSDQQSIANGTAVNSTNVYDAGSAKKLFEGAGGGLDIVVEITAAGGTTPAYSGRFVAADDAALSSNVIDLVSFGATPTLSSTNMPYQLIGKPANQRTAKRYYGMIHDMTGNADNTASVNAFLGRAAQNLIK